jgi:type VI secretion system protein ImpF
VKADLRARPVNVPVEFIAEVELDSGKIKIDRL